VNSCKSSHFHYYILQGILAERESLVQLTSEQFRSAAFHIANILLFYKTSNLNEEVNCTELSPPDSFPSLFYQGMHKIPSTIAAIKQSKCLKL
jgi:hypothetical protein